MKKALFLDRDGVINKEKHYVYKIEDFEFIEGIFESCAYFQQQDYLIFVITNQSGIARGYYTNEDFSNLTNWMLKEFDCKGVKITKVYYSPFHPEYGIGQYRLDSWCRKPNPGMLEEARKEFDLDLSQSILIGDKETDIEAGITANIGMNILVSSGCEINEKSSKADLIINSIRELQYLIK
jgi:D-glycero-D-manno-heptose 1,7-bisphosphate phosphatase